VKFNLPMISLGTWKFRKSWKKQIKLFCKVIRYQINVKLKNRFIESYAAFPHWKIINITERN
jgi:hypothetical protein